MKKIGYFCYQDDACLWMRVRQPMQQLSIRGHETKLSFLTQLVRCINCGLREIQEIPYTHQGDSYACKSCFITLMDKLDEWKQSLRDQLEWCEVAVFQRNLYDYHLEFIKEAKAKGKFVIFEADDDYIDVPKNNPGYDSYTENRPVLEEMFRAVDAMTVTTPALKAAYLPYCKKIQVIPNSYDVELFDATPPSPELKIYQGRFYNGAVQNRPLAWEEFLAARYGKKFVCWAGSPTHEDDVALMIKPLKKLIARENVIVGMCTYVHVQMIQLFPPEKLFLFSMVPVQFWFNMLRALKPDVWLGPVVRNKFNAGKSNVKKLEAAMMGCPFVGTDFDTYNQDEFDSALVGDAEYDWWRGLRWAVNISDEERADLTKKNRDILLSKYDIRVVVEQWERFFETGEVQ